MPRRFGMPMMIMHAFGTGTSSDQAVVVASATFQHGVSGIWYQWMWLFATPFYWLIAPIMRRFRAVTTADVLTLRYDQSVAVLFALVGIANMALKIGVLLKGSGALVDSCTGGTIDANLALAMITVLFVVYGTAGGLAAAIATDFVQGMMTIVFSVMLLPPLFAGGRGDGGHPRVGARPGDAVAGGAGGDRRLLHRDVRAPGAGRDHRAAVRDGRLCRGQDRDGGADRLHGRQPGEAALHDRLVPDGDRRRGLVRRPRHRPVRIKPDLVYGDLARTFLPRIMPGLLGVFVAALLGGVMSACGSVMISSSGLFTENLYKPWLPGRSNRHYLVVARVTMVLVVAGGLAFAYWLPDVVAGLKIWFKVAPIMGIAFWLGLLWRRANAAGCLGVGDRGAGAWWLATRGFVVDHVQTWPIAGPLRLVWHRSGARPRSTSPGRSPSTWRPGRWRASWSAC